MAARDGRGDMPIPPTAPLKSRGRHHLPERLVVALGGNAILRRGEKGTAGEQFGHVQYAAANLTAIVREGHRIAITHGNGPQVGDILLANECAKDTLPRMPLDVCGAESQGMLGYMIRQSLENALRTAGIDRRVIIVVTQTIVDRGDPAGQGPASFRDYRAMTQVMQWAPP
jgi:carbamate kinase